jgi:Tfp pilus assembly protein PilX
MMDRIKCQKGYTLILVMVFLSLFPITIIYMLETSLMERLISRNSRDAEQAFQLAEGAVYMGAEQVYQVISRDYRTVATLFP